MLNHLTNLACLFACLVLSACTTSSVRVGGSTPTDEVIDELRDENQELRDRVTELQESIQLRLAEIERLEAETGVGTPPSAVEGAEVPRAVSIRFGRYSGSLDTDDDGRDDVIRVYLQALDQEGRFIPVAGKATLRIVAVEADQPPIELATRIFEPSAFTDTFRSGFTGTHYTLELPLPRDATVKPESVTTVVHLADAATGLTLKRQGEMRVAW